MRNLPQDPTEALFWEMCAFITSQVDDARLILWTQDGFCQFLKTYPDGTQTIIEWQFDKADFKAYAERSNETQRAAYVTQIGALLQGATDTHEKLDALPLAVRRVGYLPKKELS